MSAAVAHTALTTVAEVKAALLDGVQALDREVLDESGTFHTEAVRAIEAVSSEIEQYLKRQLIVAEHTQFFAECDWEEAGRHPDGYPYRAFLRQWPLVETGADVVTITPVARAVFARERLTEMEYFAGYRRADQTLQDLKDAGLTQLTQNPPTLPGKAADVAVQMTISRLQRQVEGLVGMARQSKRIDQVTVQSQRFAFQSDWEPGQLARLNDMRYLVV